MKVLFCEATHRLKDGNLLKVRRLGLPTITLPYLAALVPSDTDVSIVNELIEDIDFDGDYDLVGITFQGTNFSRAFEIAEEFGKRGKTVIMGGMTVSNNPEFALQQCSSVVVGEAELVMEDLLNDFKKGQLKRIYSSNRLCDLAAIPSPRYDLMDRKKYNNYMPVQASRGCPQRCTYCSMATVYKGRYRTRPIENIVGDIRTLKHLGYRRVFFIDDNLIVNKQYSKELLKALVPLNVRWSGQSAMSALQDDEVLDLIGESGCEVLAIGFETINQDAPRAIHKKSNTVAAYRATIDKLKSRGVHVMGMLMFGFDQDDPTVFDSTYRFFSDVGISLPECFILVPTPGTPIFDQFKKEGRLLHEDYSKYNVSEVVFKPKNMTPEELQAGYWSTFERFYSIRSIVDRIFWKGPRGDLWLKLRLLGLNLKQREQIRRARERPGDMVSIADIV
jgi:radical SAM superfamily enzyme YgiQ (UPF0313 family)